MSNTLNSESLRGTRITVALVVLLSAAAINLLRLANQDFKPTMSDFKPIFTACKVFLDGGDPYDDGNIKSKWTEIQESEVFKDPEVPGLPNTPFVYPPLVLVLFAPATMFGWNVVVFFLLVMNLIVLAGVMIIIARLGGFLNSKAEMLLFVLLLLSLKAVYLGWSVGQIVFLSLFLSMLGVYFAKENRFILAALFLCCGLVKPLVALPFILYILLLKQYRVLAYAIGFFATGNLTIFFFLSDSALITYLNVVNLTLLPGGINDYSFQNDRFYGLTSLHGIIFWITNSRDVVAMVTNLIMLMALIFFIVKRRTFFSRPDHVLIFLIFGSLILAYHRVYDTIMLVVVFLAMKPSTLVQRMAWRTIFLAPLMFPVTGLALRLRPELPVELYHLAALNVPISLMVLCVLWLVVMREQPVSSPIIPTG